MAALSSSQKKTAFAGILVALIAVGVMVSGRGGFSGLRSDVFNNPSFVCAEETQTSGKAKYDQSEADIQKFSAEKASLQKQTQSWSADIRKNEVQIKKLEKDRTATEKKERTLEAYIKKNCAARPMPDCAAKKKELQNAKQDIKKSQNSLANEKTQSNKLRTNIQGAESSVKLLEKQIQEIQNFKEDYETCKRALVKKPSITSVSPEVGSVGTIITLYGSGFTSQSTVLIGDAVIDVTPTDVSPDGDWLKISFPQEALVNYLSDIYSLRVSNVGNVSVDSGLASNSVLFSIIPVATCNNLTVSPTSVTNGGNVNYTCSGTNATSYSVVLSRPDGTIIQTLTTPSGSVTIPQTNNYTSIKCFVNGQTTTSGTCQKIIYSNVCGNGIKEDPEQCDDGNTDNNDSCDNTCKNVVTTISGEVGITVISPNTGENYKAGDIIKIRWKTNKIDSNPDTLLAIMDDRIPDWQTASLFGSAPALNYADLISSNNGENIYEHTFVIPETFDGNLPDKYKGIYGGPHYRVHVIVLTGGKAGTPSQRIVEDYSDTPFSIISNSICGNGIKEGQEDCDDGNTNNYDSCNNTCTVELCSILGICPSSF